MAHIWILDESEWAILPLDGSLFSLRRRRSIADPSRGEIAWEEEVTLLPAEGRDRDSYALLAGGNADVRVNGIRLNLGIAFLRDRDEIRVDGKSLFYFSTERLALLAPFPGSASDAFCPRCRQPIDPGHPSVKCPGCGVWYHNSGDFPCWTYSETCALCPQATPMDAGYRWTPEGI